MESHEKAYREAEEVYRVVDARYLDFVKLAAEYPNLDLYSLKAPPELQSGLSKDDRARQKFAHTYLVDVLEVAYVHYFRTRGVPKSLREEMMAKEWDGWRNYMKKFLGTSEIGADDIVGLGSLAEKLRHPAKDDGVSLFVAASLSAPTRDALSRAGSPASEDARKSLAGDLNSVVAGPVIYDDKRFENVRLSRETSDLLGQNRDQVDHARINRLLLQDAYPGELSDKYLGRPAFRETWFELRDEYDTDFVAYMDKISPPPRKSLK